MPSWSGLWDSVFQTPFTIQQTKQSALRAVRPIVSKALRIGKLLETIPTGVSINGGSSYSIPTVSNDVGDGAINGGLRTINSVQIFGAASTTTTDDVAELKYMSSAKTVKTVTDSARL